MSNSEAGFIQSSKIMALGTIASRITGLARGLLLVAVLGTTLLGEKRRTCSAEGTVNVTN